ncbi:MAG TPA: phosphoenolpyruvate--protein phosphotransferase [Candidatus Limnocylindrales bacterium]|nr:phosphoenolpyruvate--protein phosphotransferase [Candidatus Limnocylindrales bacterium]
MRTLHGVPASTGVARGPWTRIAAYVAPPGGRIAPDAADVEIDRLTEACTAGAADLDALAATLVEAGRPSEAEIFEAHAAMALDPALLESAAAEIRAGSDAIAAIRVAAQKFADLLRGFDDELLAARATDILDVAERIVARLAGVDRTITLDRPSIVVAEDIPPSLAAGLPRDRLLGLALESGSATSHAAILARAFGIPAVVGIQGLLAATDQDDAGGTELVVDGDTGEVVLDPDAAASERLERRRTAVADAARTALAEAGLPVVTTDGVEVTLLANIGSPAEAQRAVALGARGVGLFRTEFLFVERSSPPTEDEQTAVNRAVVEAFAPGPVTIRLLDVGGDKPIPYLPIPLEANPFLGVRALRLAPDRPELFVTQLRAAMRAAARATGAGDKPIGRVKVMAPMVADATDVDLLLDLADEARRSLEADGTPHGEVDLGVMLEIPSAVLVGGSFLGRLRFASLGTNDLLQYTLAADRGNATLERYRDSLHPALLRLIAMAAEDAARAGVELSVCGEMGGDPAAALALVGLGLRVLSMGDSSLAPVRRAIRASNSAALRTAATEALGASTAAEVRTRFESMLPPSPADH